MNHECRSCLINWQCWKTHRCLNWTSMTFIHNNRYFTNEITIIYCSCYWIKSETILESPTQMFFISGFRTGSKPQGQKIKCSYYSDEIFDWYLTEFRHMIFSSEQYSKNTLLWQRHIRFFTSVICTCKRIYIYIYIYSHKLCITSFIKYNLECYYYIE